MSPQKDGRALGRWLILGVTENETVFSYLASPESALSNELENTSLIETTNVFSEIDIQHQGVPTDTRTALISKLFEIHEIEIPRRQHSEIDRSRPKAGIQYL